MEKKKSTAEKRSLNWLFIVYPESLPSDWQDRLKSLHIAVVVSPLHDRDVNEADDEEKKAHYHILLLFPSLKTDAQVKEITQMFCGTIPVRCHGVKGSIRYFTHKDNPEKFQGYSEANILTFGGADLNSLCAPTSAERLKIQQEIIDFCHENDISEYEDIVMYTRNEGKDDWFDVLMNRSTISITAFLRSKRHKKERGDYPSARENISVDANTGEIISNSKEDTTDE